MADVGGFDGCAGFCLQCGGHPLAAGPPTHDLASRTDQLESGLDPSCTHGAVGIFDHGLEHDGRIELIHRPDRDCSNAGHASWHAYRDLVDTHDIPERMPRQEAD